jgi:hypothetical protein
VPLLSRNRSETVRPSENCWSYRFRKTFGGAPHPSHSKRCVAQLIDLEGGESPRGLSLSRDEGNSNSVGGRGQVGAGAGWGPVGIASAAVIAEAAGAAAVGGGRGAAADRGAAGAGGDRPEAPHAASTRTRRTSAAPPLQASPASRAARQKGELQAKAPPPQGAGGGTCAHHSLRAQRRPGSSVTVRPHPRTDPVTSARTRSSSQLAAAASTLASTKRWLGGVRPALTGEAGAPPNVLRNR